MKDKSDSLKQRVNLMRLGKRMEKQLVEGKVKRQKASKPTMYRKLWKAIMAHVLNGVRYKEDEYWRIKKVKSLLEAVNIGIIV